MAWTWRRSANFHAGLLRHIAIEEKLVFPALREARGGALHPDWMRLRIEHGAITSLLVPTPTPDLVSEIRSVLEPTMRSRRDRRRSTSDELPPGLALVIERVSAYPPVRVAPYRDGPRVLRPAADALRVSVMQFDKVGGRS